MVLLPAVMVTALAWAAPPADRTLEAKPFTKIDRYEGVFQPGWVTNDLFVQRQVVGAGIGYHVSEVLGVELLGSFSPDFGRADWRGRTRQLVDENRVQPDISQVLYTGTADLQFAPIWGKFAIGRRILDFDVFALAGMGVVQTHDDLAALQCEDDPACLATASQLHPTSDLGVGVRVIFSQQVALRVEYRSMLWIETIDSTTLETKNQATALVTGSYFFPNLDG
jgi:outer membrane beta-barrel protein